MLSHYYSFSCREINSLGDKLNELKYLNVAKDKELKQMEREKERMKEVRVGCTGYDMTRHRCDWYNTTVPITRMSA